MHGKNVKKNLSHVNLINKFSDFVKMNRWTGLLNVQLCETVQLFAHFVLIIMLLMNPCYQWQCVKRILIRGR